jgi:rhodanese-related sulfurtransferase
MLKKLLYVLLVLSLAIFVACDDDSKDSVNEFELVTAAGDDYYTTYKTSGGLDVNTTIDAIFTNLTDGDTSNDPFIIDYRSADDFATGRLKDAVNMSIADLIDRVEDGTVPADKVILNVCYSGQNASVATAVLNMLGYEAQNLKFGMCSVVADDAEINKTTKWSGQIEQDEYTLDKNAVAAPTTSYDFPEWETGHDNADDVIKARFAEILDPSWGVAFADVITNPEDYFIVNYWGADDYNNIGHIEGAYQFTPKMSLKSDEMLENLPTDKKIVIYCWTGQTSAQVISYLRILGYEAYSLLYGVNGFAFGELPDGKPRYHEPSGDYSSIVEE